jgi:hypothetical protein
MQLSFSLEGKLLLNDSNADSTERKEVTIMCSKVLYQLIFRRFISSLIMEARS